jgi:hypothetical protein
MTTAQPEREHGQYWYGRDKQAFIGRLRRLKGQ